MINSTAVAVSALRVQRGGQEVLRSLNCSVPTGSITGLLGPSGCGKTTLMRSVVGVQAATKGTITVLGQPAGSASLRTRIGYGPQSPAVYADITVKQNLGYFASVLRAPKSDVARVISAVGLEDQAGNLASRLSGGQRSRTSLAVALLGTPDLLVLDEPTVGLDPVLRDDLWSLFHRLAEQGVTLLISSHVMDEAARCGNLLLMREGSILAEDSPDGLREKTGTADLDQAFLRLVRENQAVPA